MKTIVVPTDFSATAENAMNFAVELAKKENAKIILIHAFHVSNIYPEVPIQYLNEQTKSAERVANTHLNLLCEKIKRSSTLECDFICKEDSIVDFILDTIKENKPDIVVMGTKGVNDFFERIMGSTTSKIVEKANCPVIVVPANTLFKPINAITYATDYYLNDIFALRKLVVIAKLFDAKITLLHVCYDMFTHETEEEFMHFFKTKVIDEVNYDKIAYKLIYGKNLIDTLEDYVKHESPDLLTMSTHCWNLFDQLFGSSSTKSMTYYTNVPLLAFHYKQVPIVFD